MPCPFVHPSVLKVNPFDAQVPAASFDPLNKGAAGAGVVAAAAAGGGYSNGGGAGGGGWAGGGGDSTAVLQLGMQFEVRREERRERESSLVVRVAVTVR